jgi:hypothetical protein
MYRWFIALQLAVDANGAELQLGFVERTLEAGRSRIGVDVLNPLDRLMPGQRVTVVVVLE